MLSLIQESPFLQLVVQVLPVLLVEIPGHQMVEVPEQLPVVVDVSMWKQPPPWLIMQAIRMQILMQRAVSVPDFVMVRKVQ